MSLRIYKSKFQIENLIRKYRQLTLLQSSLLVGSIFERNTTWTTDFISSIDRGYLYEDFDLFNELKMDLRQYNSIGRKYGIQLSKLHGTNPVTSTI